MFVVVVVAAVSLPALLGSLATSGSPTPTDGAGKGSPSATSSPSGPTVTPTVTPRPLAPVLPPQVTTLAGGYRVYGQALGIAPAYTVDWSALRTRAAGTVEPLQGVVVILDPGHGGQDGGAVYPMSNKAEIIEKQVVLAVALRVKTDLEALGATVVMTRTTDIWVSLYNRIARTGIEVLERHADFLSATGSRAWPDAEETLRLAALLQPCIDINSDKLTSGGLGIMRGLGATPDLRTIMDVERMHGDVVFVALHCNANNSVIPNGLEVMYTSNRTAYRSDRTTSEGSTAHPTYRFYDDEGRKRLAQALYDGIIGTTPDLVTTTGVSLLVDQNLAVLREMNLVGVLVEMGYVTNERDRKILLSEEGRDRIATGVANGLLAYFKGG
jgi:N-acetylmuramoyl-L-alanine amidase